jgi:trehalose-6-phosphate synthase
VLVVANRLPIKARRNDVTGEWTFEMSSGGLVTALQVSVSSLQPKGRCLLAPPASVYALEMFD